MPADGWHQLPFGCWPRMGIRVRSRHWSADHLLGFVHLNASALHLGSTGAAGIRCAGTVTRLMPTTQVTGTAWRAQIIGPLLAQAVGNIFWRNLGPKISLKFGQASGAVAPSSDRHHQHLGGVGGSGVDDLLLHPSPSARDRNKLAPLPAWAGQACPPGWSLPRGLHRRPQVGQQGEMG